MNISKFVIKFRGKEYSCLNMTDMLNQIYTDAYREGYDDAQSETIPSTSIVSSIIGKIEEDKK